MAHRERALTVVAYIPAIHRGYLEMFGRYPGGDIGVLDSDLLAGLNSFRKDVQALEPIQAVELLRGYFPDRTVRAIGASALIDIAYQPEHQIVMPYDEVARSLLRTHLSGRDVTFEPVFLRWDRSNVTAEQPITGVDEHPLSVLDLKVIERLVKESELAGNMWRRVGAVLFGDIGVIDGAHNESQPTAYTQAIEGDPRNAVSRGVGIEFSNDLHAEAALIARAAREGRTVKGMNMVVTTFPCPVCAKSIAESGISTLYFCGDYASLDGQRVMEAAGVRLIRITDLEDNRSGPEWRAYNSSNSL